MRLVSALSFFFLKVPNTKIASLTVLCIICCSYAEQLVIYSLFTKRLPGDVRGAMRGIFYSCGSLGQLLMSLSSFYIVKAGYTLTSPFIVVATLDAVMLYFSLMMGLAGVFDEDKFVGLKGEQESKAGDVELNEFQFGKNGEDSIHNNSRTSLFNNRVKPAEREKNSEE